MDLRSVMKQFYYDISLNELQLMNKGSTFGSLTYNSLLYLDIIESTPNCTVSLLGDLLGVAKSSVTLKVNELLKQGYLKKTQSERDKRVYYLSINPAVSQEYRQYDTLLNDAIAEIEQQFTKEQIDLCISIITAFNKAYHREIYPTS